MRGLSRYVREKSHESRALDRESEFALVRRRDVRALLALDAGVWIEEFLEYIDVFVVDMLDSVLFKETLFAHDNLLEFLIFTVFDRLERDVFWIDVF